VAQLQACGGKQQNGTKSIANASVAFRRLVLLATPIAAADGS